ncbi:MAG: anhydro-N-acetylmuramic acid kinase [Aestuariibaculum sp.]
MVNFTNMIKNDYKVIGVMSGTSLDGIDLVYVHFKFEDNWKFDLICCETIYYNDYWVEKLGGLINYSKETLLKTDETYTAFLAGTIKTFIDKYNIKTINAVCSHGHTALHIPERGLTYQIGNTPQLAKLLGKKIVCDFRVQDVALGGQGAPLVPIGDRLLFAEYDFCLNLGGFANISTENNSKRIAYDICPVNIVLNKYVGKLGFPFDDGGKIAATGSINPNLLKALNTIAFYAKKPPKSLGLEWVETTVFSLIESFNLMVKDILRTFVEHIAYQLALEINKKSKASVLVTGGGVYNTFLMQRLTHYTQNTIVVPNSDIVEFKEALIFGFLGVLKLENQNNCLKSVTGASKNHSSGKIFLP